MVQRCKGAEAQRRRGIKAGTVPMSSFNY
jgi:hypothetical protein